MGQCRSIVLLVALVGAVPALAQRKPPPIIRVPAPVTINTVPTREACGDWQVEPLIKGLYLASTGNQSGSRLGVLCNADGCTSVFNPRINCEDKAKYPALLNSPSGAYNQILTCEVIGESYLLSLSDEDAIQEAMSIGGTIGIAFPMQSGEFNVSRFSMTGAARAYARAAQLARNSPARGSSQPSVKDTRY